MKLDLTKYKTQYAFVSVFLTSIIINGGVRGMTLVVVLATIFLAGYITWILKQMEAKD